MISYLSHHLSDFPFIGDHISLIHCARIDFFILRGHDLGVVAGLDVVVGGVGDSAGVGLAAVLNCADKVVYSIAEIAILAVANDILVANNVADNAGLPHIHGLEERDRQAFPVAGEEEGVGIHSVGDGNGAVCPTGDGDVGARELVPQVTIADPEEVDIRKASRDLVKQDRALLVADAPQGVDRVGVVLFCHAIGDGTEGASVDAVVDVEGAAGHAEGLLMLALAAADGGAITFSTEGLDGVEDPAFHRAVVVHEKAISMRCVEQRGACVKCHAADGARLAGVHVDDVGLDFARNAA